MSFVTAAPPAVAMEPEQRARGGQADAGRNLLDRLEKTAIADYRGGRVTVRRGRPAGCFLYGPYWQLAAGHYRLSFQGAARRPLLPDAPVLGVDVVALGRFQQAWRDFTVAELQAGRCSLDFAVPPELGIAAGDEARFEFRFFHLGNADLALTAVTLAALDEEQAPVLEPRRWRLFGRLEGRVIGTPRSECLRVRRWEPSGCVLAARRPWLPLPAGHYRLSFRCRAGRPLLASEPVLGVEILACHRWRGRPRRQWRALGQDPFASRFLRAWRDFTAAELGQEQGVIDFVVPRELALEAGEDVPFDFRFLHFGNADLTIAEVELRQLSAAPEGLESADSWRLFWRMTKRPRLGAADDRIPPHRLGRLRPPLELPAGRYRLSFGVHLTAPHAAPEPVLEVAVLARRSAAGVRRSSPLPQARHGFTAAELQQGEGAVTFAVPPECARESGAGVRFDFAFTALGGARLAIGPVVLRALPQAVPAGDHPATPDVTVAAPALVKPARLNVVVVGNCQALTVHEALSRAGRLGKTRVEARYHFVELQKSLHEQGRRELAQCDVLLVQEIRDWERYPLREAIPRGMPIIGFPLLHFASLWPFDHYNGPNDREAYEREWPNLTFLYLDGLLGRLRREIPDREERFRAYRDLAVPGVVNYVRLHDFEQRRLLAMDRKYEFGIGRFILDHFRHRQLFYTTNHPNGQILTLLMQYLVKRLGCDEPYRPRKNLDQLRRLQVPVHPKVARALGVTWANENTRYAYRGRKITWESYVRAYIDHYG
jgi:hypothetical protein